MPHRPSRRLVFGLTLLVAAVLSCNDAGTGPEADRFDIQFLNFGTVDREMGLQGERLIDVPGDPSTGSPRTYPVDNPGIGSTLTFVAVSGGGTLTTTCTVSSVTNVSVAPQVVIQPAFEELDCVDW